MDLSHWTTGDTPLQADNIGADGLPDAGAFLTDLESGKSCRLNRMAFTVWTACDGKTTIDAIAKQFADKYKMEFDTALQKVTRLVADFAAADLTQ